MYVLTLTDRDGGALHVEPRGGGHSLFRIVVAVVPGTFPGVYLTEADRDALIRFLVDLPTPEPAAPDDRVRPHDPWDPTPTGRIVVTLDTNADPDEVAARVRELLRSRGASEGHDPF